MSIKTHLFHLIWNPPINHLCKEFQLISCIEVHIQTLGVTTLVYATLLSVFWVSPIYRNSLPYHCEMLKQSYRCLFMAPVQSFLGSHLHPCSALGMTLPVGFRVGGVLGSSLDSRLQSGIGWLWTVPHPVLIQSPDSDVHPDSSHYGSLSKHFNYQIHDRSYIFNDWMKHRKSFQR